MNGLPDVESHVEMVLRASGPLTQPQIAAKVYGCPIHATGDAEADTARRSAIRSVQAAIQSLRRRDVPIIDSPEGMRIARSAEECEVEFRRLRSRIRSQVLTAWGLRRAARRMRGAEVEQTRLWTEAA